MDNYRTRDNKGEKHPKSKLSKSDVIEILNLIENGTSQNAIATKFGVSNSTISAIRKGKTWTHLRIK